VILVIRLVVAVDAGVASCFTAIAVVVAAFKAVVGARANVVVATAVTAFAVVAAPL